MLLIVEYQSVVDSFLPRLEGSPSQACLEAVPKGEFKEVTIQTGEGTILKTYLKRWKVDSFYRGTPSRSGAG